MPPWKLIGKNKKCLKKGIVSSVTWCQKTSSKASMTKGSFDRATKRSLVVVTETIYLIDGVGVIKPTLRNK